MDDGCTHLLGSRSFEPPHRSLSHRGNAIPNILPPTGRVGPAAVAMVSHPPLRFTARSGVVPPRATPVVTHPPESGRVECLKTGSEWVHLRPCQACGVTLCCDNSLNRHATRQAQLTAHPVIATAEPGEQ